jgi:hypothetical protein
VTVNPIPATPTITPGGPTTFCAGGSVTLTSSAASGNQWYLNGNPIGGATNQNYIATATGNYTVIDTALGCSSAPSAATTVTVNPNPDATITTAAQECAGSTGNTASVANAGGGATYSWSITNGTITGGTGTTNITYTAGPVGTLTLQVTVTTALSCSDTKSANVTINAIPSKPTITPGGPTTFPPGGSVTLNSSSASGNQWYLNGNPIGGATNSSLVATAAGNYTVIVTTSGCASPASDATAVTVCASAPVVTNANDSGPGSLRQAILDACDGATITFDMNQVVSPINLTTADLVIDKNLTITGPGANTLTVQRSTAGGTPNFSVFTINSGKVVTISGLTISNGKAAAGGGIFNQGTLALSACTVTGNSAPNSSGGGILSQASGGPATVTITNSTISGNSSFNGGGILNFAATGTATLTINNSTINGNSVPGSGGGIYNFAQGGNTATLTITNGTISGNSATGGLGGGIFNSTASGGTATPRLSNTIVAGNTTNSTTPNDIDGTVDPSSSFNLIGNGGAGGLANGVNNNQVGVANALLASLGNYGGPTQTMALLPGSPAIDAGSNTLANNAGLTTDQRGAGFNRIVNTTVDIGAFESRGFTISTTSGTPQTTFPNNAFGLPLVATVSSTFTEPVAGGLVTFTAPNSGASATLNGGGITFDATINASGQASTSATANSIVGGPYNVTAGAAGISGTAAFSLTNIKFATTTAVASSVNPSDLNQSVTFTATVTSSSGTPTGTVQFRDNGNPLGSPVSLNPSGVAQLSNSSLASGLHVISADYSGDAHFAPSTGSLNPQTVKPQPTLSINDVSMAEGDSGTTTMNFTVTLSAASSLTTKVDFATANGTATAPSDYVATNGTLTFNPGDLTKTISVTINGDVTFEPDETFTVNLSNPINSGISKGIGIGTIQNDDTIGGVINFTQSTATVSEASGLLAVTIVRTNNLSNVVTVDYATDDTGASTNCGQLNTGLASSRCDFEPMFGTLKFAANENQKTINIPINRDGFNEGAESFKFLLSNPTGGAILGAPFSLIITITDSQIPGANAIDDPDLFVKQQYHDFLNREPDAAGLAFWTDNITKCNDPTRIPPGQTVAQCIENQRVITSAAFFLSIEFKQTGGLVRDFYVAALNRPATGNMPAFGEFIRDTQGIQRGIVVGQGNWQAQLTANQIAFENDFVMRPEFIGLYPTTDTPAQYVDKLYLHANVTPSAPERNNAIAEFGGAATAADPGARGRALLRITQNAAFQARETNRAFVQMEYFGYLRRNPNDPPDGNFNGYNFWVNKLNQFNGDFLQAEMVKAFLNSNEYRQRFGN